MDCRMSGPVPALLPLVYLVYICNQVILFNQRTAKQLSAEKASQVHPIIAFRAEPDLHAWADGQAAMEGISRSDVARRALIRDRQRQQAEESHA
jgi:hypothetical protein